MVGVRVIVGVHVRVGVRVTVGVNVEVDVEVSIGVIVRVGVILSVGVRLGGTGLNVEVREEVGTAFSMRKLHDAIIGVRMINSKIMG